MKSRLLKGFVLIILLFVAYWYNHYAPFYNIEGRYALINYEESSVWPIGPDTLQLSNGRYSSRVIGKGTYSYSRTLGGLKIKFEGSEGFSTHIKRNWFGPAMIVVFDDLNQGYVKID